MKLEDQVCSLELAKRLKALGVKQESLWYWWHHWSLENKRIWSVGHNDDSDLVNEKVAAFTVAELGEMLPEFVQSGRDGIGWLCFKARQDYETPYFNGDTEADARAKMLIHLIEQKLVKPEGASQ